jgi:ABC-type transporter Mla subunit MlaD
MRDRTRNVLVGLTVLIALLVLGGMLIVFREVPAFLQPGYMVKVRLPHSSGLTAGADVEMAGKRIGRVTEVEFTEADPRLGVTVTALIHDEHRIPGTVNPYVVSRGLGGGAVLEFRVDDLEPGASRELEWLPTDRVLTLTPPEGARPGGGLIPPELLADVRLTMASFRKVADNLNAFIGPPPEPDGPDGQPTTAPARRANLHVTIAKLDKALEAVNTIVGDRENQENIREALNDFRTAAAAMNDAMAEVHATAEEARAGLRRTTTQAAAISGKFETVAQRLVEDADRLGVLLETLNVAAEKLSSDTGTAGKLLNDPKLYNELVDTTEELQRTLQSVRELMREWRRRGVKLKLP